MLTALWEENEAMRQMVLRHLGGMETQVARRKGGWKERGRDDRDDQIQRARHGWARGPFIPHMQADGF
jgi:hypothetical protein